jgi:hypothetical protein
VVSDEKHKFWHCVMSIGRCVRACKRLSEAAKALTTRDHVRGISGPSTLFNSIPFKEPFDFKRLKFSTTDTTIMRAADLPRRQQQGIPLPDVIMEDNNDLPLTFPTSMSQASQMEIPSFLQIPSPYLVSSGPLSPSRLVYSVMSTLIPLPLRLLLSSMSLVSSFLILDSTPL